MSDWLEEVREHLEHKKDVSLLWHIKNLAIKITYIKDKEKYKHQKEDLSGEFSSCPYVILDSVDEVIDYIKLRYKPDEIFVS